MKPVATGILGLFMLLSGPFVGFPGYLDLAHAAIIKGSVVNETLDKKGMENLEVTLFQYQKNETTEIGRTRADQKGLYVFKDVEPDKDKKYYTSARYKDLTYYSQILNFQQDSEINLDVNVFEPTDQDDNVQIKVHHVVVKAFEDGLEFNEIIIIENTGNTTYVGKPRDDSGKNQTLLISLPKGASGVQMADPSLIESADGLSDTAAIIPGTKRIFFSYWVHPDAGTYRFEKTFHQQTEKFNMIFPDTGIQVKSDQFEIKVAAANSGEHYMYLDGQNLARNDHVAVELSRRRETAPFKWIVVGLLTLLMSTAFILSFLKVKKQQ